MPFLQKPMNMASDEYPFTEGQILRQVLCLLLLLVFCFVMSPCKTPMGLYPLATTCRKDPQQSHKKQACEVISVYSRPISEGNIPLWFAKVFCGDPAIRICYGDISAQSSGHLESTFEPCPYDPKWLFLIESFRCWYFRCFSSIIWIEASKLFIS